MNLMRRKLRYDQNRSFDFLHLCYYFSKSSFRDEDQRRIIDFKRGEEPAIRYFIVEAISQLRYFNFSSDDFIVRALSSNELQPVNESNIGLERLGKSLAGVFDCSFYPPIIYKTRPTSAIKQLSAAERKRALSGVYAVNQMFDLHTRKLIIIDDVVTTGSTTCAIIEAILKVYPKANITVFSLAWTPTAKQQEYLRRLEQDGKMLNDPVAGYGDGRVDKWVDEDFLNGETYISVV